VITPARRLILVALLLAAPVAAGKKPALPSADELIDRAEVAIEAGSIDPQRDLAPLVERLRTTQVEDEQDSLVRSIATMGRHDGRSPASVKAYLSEAAPAALLAVARGKSNAQIRGDALMALRSLNVPTQLVIYPGENHGLTVPSYLRDRLERNLAWYDKYLKP